jgi:hypothetical protein
MPNLTSQQVNELANHFLAMAEEISNYRYKNFEKLSKEENKQLKESHSDLLDKCDELYTLSASLVLEDVQTALSSINSITTEIKATYTTLVNIQKAINVAASVVTLASSVLSKDPKAIGGSITALVNTLKPDTKKDEKKIS